MDCKELLYCAQYHILFYLKNNFKTFIMSPVTILLSALTLSTLSKIFSRQHIEIFFLIFPRKQVLTFYANCLQWRQFS